MNDAVREAFDSYVYDAQMISDVAFTIPGRDEDIREFASHLKEVQMWVRSLERSFNELAKAKYDETQNKEDTEDAAFTE